MTDTITSYYAFSYSCGDIQWSGQGFETAVVGYDSRGDYFHNHPANGFHDIGQIVSCTQPQGEQRKRRNDPGNGGTVGQMPANPTMQEAIKECRSQAQNSPDVNTIRDRNGNIVDIVDMLPPCPRTRTEVAGSVMFRLFPDGNGDCFQSRINFQPDPLANPNVVGNYRFVSVCCYETSSG